jgi:uncharacterized membrane protein
VSRRREAGQAAVYGETILPAWQRNPDQIALIGALLLVVLGMVPGMIGLAVTLPLVAYATWHAYRDVVRFD